MCRRISWLVYKPTGWGFGRRGLSPSGRIFREGTMDFLLEEREIKEKHRRSGSRTKGLAKRTGLMIKDSGQSL